MSDRLHKLGFHNVRSCEGHRHRIQFAAVDFHNSRVLTVDAQTARIWQMSTFCGGRAVNRGEQSACEPSSPRPIHKRHGSASSMASAISGLSENNLSTSNSQAAKESMRRHHSTEKVRARTRDGSVLGSLGDGSAQELGQEICCWVLPATDFITSTVYVEHLGLFAVACSDRKLRLLDVKRDQTSHIPGEAGFFSAALVAVKEMEFIDRPVISMLYLRASRRLVVGSVDCVSVWRLQGRQTVSARSGASTLEEAFGFTETLRSPYEDIEIKKRAEMLVRG